MRITRLLTSAAAVLVAACSSHDLLDVKTDGVVWRFVVLDSNKSLLGSRWTEEMRSSDGFTVTHPRGL